MSTTLTAPAPKAEQREAYDRALAKLEPILDQAIALAFELRSLSGEIFERMSDDELNEVLSSRPMEDKIYAKLDLLKSATNCEIWI